MKLTSGARRSVRQRERWRVGPVGEAGPKVDWAERSEQEREREEGKGSGLGWKGRRGSFVCFFLTQTPFE